MTDTEFETEARKRMKARGCANIEIVNQPLGSAVRPVIAAACTYRGERMEVAFTVSSDPKLNDISKQHILRAIEGLGAKS